MIISLIVAMDSNRGIGRDNTLPWRLSDDLKAFKARTMGHHIVVGRKTFDSIGRALPGRHMLIISRSTSMNIEGCDVVDSLERALSLAQSRDETECFVIGGAEIYRQAIDRADKIYLTFVDATVNADTFFPAIDISQWKENSRQVFAKDDRNEFAFSIVELQRRHD